MTVDIAVASDAVALGGAGMVLGLGALNRRLRRAEMKRKSELGKLLALASVLRRAEDDRKRTHGHRQIASVFAGGYGGGTLTRLSWEFARAGASECLNAPLYIEFHTERREQTLNDMEPTLRGRVVPCACSHFPSGMLGGTIEDVEAEPVKGLWHPDVSTKADAWIARMEHDCEYDPSCLLAVCGQNGHVALLRPAMEAFARRFPHAPIYLISAVDQLEPRRIRFQDVQEYFNHDHLVRGYILTDNRRDYKRSDTGLAVLFPTLVTSGWIGARSIDLADALALLFPTTDPGRAATISVFGESISVHRHKAWRFLWMSVPEVFYTEGRRVEEKIMRGVRTLYESPQLRAMPLEVVEEGVDVACVAAPIVPEHLMRNLARAEEGIATWMDKKNPNFVLQGASIGVPMNKHTQEVPLIVVLLQRLVASPDEIGAYAKGQLPVDPKFLPSNGRNRRKEVSLLTESKKG